MFCFSYTGQNCIIIIGGICYARKRPVAFLIFHTLLSAIFPRTCKQMRGFLKAGLAFLAKLRSQLHSSNFTKYIKFDLARMQRVAPSHLYSRSLVQRVFSERRIDYTVAIER